MFEEIDGIQKIVDLEEGGMLFEYYKHRLSMGYKYAKLFELYPNVKRAFSIESTIVDPSWRKQNIALHLHKESLNVTGPSQSVLLEGMMPKQLWNDGLFNKLNNNRSQIGFKLYTTEFTNDDFACPLWCRPPSELPR